MQAKLKIQGKVLPVTDLVTVTDEGVSWDGALERLINDMIHGDCECCDSCTAYGTDFFSFFNGQELVANLEVRV